jgi:hypothetical protein
MRSIAVAGVPAQWTTLVHSRLAQGRRPEQGNSASVAVIGTTFYITREN